METSDLFNFELIEDKGYLSVTGKINWGEFSLCNNRIKRVIIPEGYTSIEKLAFNQQPRPEGRGCWF